MSQSSSSSSGARSGGVGRVLLWVAIVLSVALLSFVTALAIRTNPLYSDYTTNGISKYKFLEKCKDELESPNELKVSLQGQEVPLKDLISQSAPLAAGERIHVELTADSVEWVEAARANPEGGWLVSSPVFIDVRGGKDGEKPVGAAGLQCLYTKKDKQLVAQLVPPAQ